MSQVRQGPVALVLLLCLSACGGDNSTRTPITPNAPTPTPGPVTLAPGAPELYAVAPSAVTPGTVSLTIEGGNIDPATAQVVVTGPGCVGDTACVVPNAQLTTKATNRLVAPVTVGEPGGFTIRIQHGPGGPFSNGRPLTVSPAPTLLVDGADTSTRARGQTFVFTGTNYAPGGMVIRMVNPPIDGVEVLLPFLSADAAGTVTWSFTPACGDPVGTWTIWLVDDDSGHTSNKVTYSVTKGSGC